MSNTPPADAPRAPRVRPASAEEYRDLVAAFAGAAILLVDDAGRVRTWNAGAERLFGYAAEEVTGQPVAVLFDPDEGRGGRSEGGALEGFGGERRCLRKGGSRFGAEVVLAGPAGRARGLIITERAAPPPVRRTEGRAERRFQELVEAVSDYAIFLLDVSGNIASWNLGARRIKGYEEHEVVGRHFSMFYPEEDRARGRPEEVLRSVRRDGRFEEEAFRVRKGGTRFWASVLITPLRTERGEITGFVKITRDLTERRAAEQRLRESEERFRLLVESVSDYAIYMLSPEGVVQTWNVGAERMKGYTAAEIIGQSFERFFPERDRREGRPQQELATAAEVGRFEEEGCRVRKNGETFWANVVVTAIRGERGELVGFAKVTRDLTARRAAEETARELARAQAARAIAEAVARKADEANRVKDEFLATVSHELRTPLNAIVGWASLLRERQLDPTVARAVSVIERNAQAQVKIIEDILDVSRIIAGKMRLDPKATDLVGLVNQAIEVTRHSAAAKGITIDFQQAESECPLVGDPERIQQVVWNLLSNAIKFTPSGGAVTIRIEPRPEQVALAISDTGIGLDPEFLPFLFERFKQGDSSTTRRFGGLGLGLALVRHITELHGGAVTAASPGLGQGATFVVTFPRQLEARAAVGISAPPEAASLDAVAPGALEGLRVLVVEDDPDARELVTAVLVAAGAVVEAACSAAAGYDKLASFRPQVLVSDIAMPDEDGLSLMRRIRALAPAQGGRIPSVALTAYTRSEDRTKALAAGFTTHVGKPVNPADLVAALANLAAYARP